MQGDGGDHEEEVGAEGGPAELTVEEPPPDAGQCGGSRDLKVLVTPSKRISSNWGEEEAIFDDNVAGGVFARVHR